MKRKLSLLMVLMMIISLVPMSVFADTAELTKNSEDVQGYVGGAEIVVAFTTDQVADFGIGTTIAFDSRDDIERADGTLASDVSVSGNVATIRKNDLGKAIAFNVELGDELGLRRLTITTGNTVDRYFYAEVVSEGRSGAELLQSKTKITRGQEAKEVASFILRSPGEGEVKLTLPRNFEWSTDTEVIGAGNYKITVNPERKNVATFNVSSANANENYVINPFIFVTRSASFGDVDVAIDSDDISADLTIAEYVDFNVVVKVDKERTILGGENVEVKVTLDGVDGAFTNRDIEFEVNGGEVKVKSLTNGFTVIEPTDWDDVDADPIDEFFVKANLDEKKTEIKLDVFAELDAKDGEVTLTVKGGGVEEQTVTLVTVKPVATFETKVTNVRVADSNVMVADIVITETEDGALSEGTYTLEFVGKDGMVPMFEDADVDVDGNIDVEVDVEDGIIELEVKAESRRDASTITIKDVKITVPRNVLPGTYEVELLNEDEDRIAKWAYVNVIEQGAFVRRTTVFTLDSTVYTVDGEQMMLDAAPYISNSRTMLPIGTMAQLLGATVNYSPVTRTAVFTRDNLVVSMNLDTNVLLVNGVPVMMDAKPEIQNSRAFVPVVFVAQAFGVQNNTDIVYDAATRTVTLFPNN